MLEVDDFGRYENSPRLIRAKVFAHQLDRWSEEDVLKSVKECAETTVHSNDGSYPLLTLYRIGGKSYLQINNFGQRIRPGQKSKYPDPPEISAKRGKNPRVTENSRMAREFPAYSESESESESNKTFPAFAGADELAAQTFGLTDEERSAALPEIPGVDDVELEQIATRIHQRHPAPRRCPRSEVLSRLKAILRKQPTAKRRPVMLLIDSNHALYCESEQWTKDSGEFAKGLDNWLAPTKGRWEDPPARASPSPAERPGHMNPGLID
jgi:hypothetical protein